LLGPKLIDAPGECRSNHEVIAALAKRLGAVHKGFDMSPRELIDWTLQASGWGTLAELEEKKFIDCQPPFEQAHYLDGFAHADKKFHFSPEWTKVPMVNAGPMGRAHEMPKFPDYWDVVEKADTAHPFRLATSPSRGYLNSSFNETPGSRKREGKPKALMHPDDLAKLGLVDDQKIIMGNERGQVRLWTKSFDGIQPGVIVVEGIVPNDEHEDGAGINTLTGADQGSPFGGAAFHDNHVWVRAM
jgi:anaerobic selenocysteine-containing dehydrogenase